MKIVPQQDESFIRQSGIIKFLLAEQDANLVLALATPFYGEHIRLLPEDAQLIGSGDIIQHQHSIDVRWGSHSCKRELGYDRPEASATATDLLARIRNQISRWLANA